MGVSPHQYGKARRIEGLRSELRSGTDVTSAVYEVGFNSNSVAYAQAKPGLGMTPRRWRDGGRGERIYYTVLASDLGQVLVAATNAGLVAVRIGDEAALVTEVRAEFPLADFRRDDKLLSQESHAVLSRTLGLTNLTNFLDIAATAFQARVWSALRVIPSGETRSYADVATMIGEPTAVRAVARACASNPVALVVPCHRWCAPMERWVATDGARGERDIARGGRRSPTPMRKSPTALGVTTGRRHVVVAWQTWFVLLGAIWGCSFWWIKLGLRSMSPVDVAFARLVAGAATLLLIAYLPHAAASESEDVGPPIRLSRC